MDLIVETSEDMFSAQGVKVNRRIQPLFKEGVSMWAELENKWVLNKNFKKKAAREKQQVTYKGIPIRLTVDFSAKLCKPEGSGKTYLK